MRFIIDAEMENSLKELMSSKTKKLKKSII